MRAIAYCRVSTQDQSDNGISLAAQQTKLTAYCQAMDIELVRIEVDAGISAATLRRPALQRALASLKRGEVDTLIVVKLDRLTRSVRDLCDLVDAYFRGEHRSLISLGESIDTRSAAGRMVLSMLTVVAAWEREACGERVAAVRAYQRSRNEFCGGDAPYGHTVVDGQIVPVEAEQTVIATARDLRAAGHTMRAIGAALASRGMVARNGKPFAAGQVARLVA